MNRYIVATILIASCFSSALTAPNVIDHSIRHFDKIQHVNMPSDVKETFPTVLDITRKLTKLFVTGSQMRITADIFSGAHHLEMINLSDSDIKEIDEHAFYGADKLKKLDLSGNKLKSLPREMFPQTNVLKELDLSKNNIDTISRSTFKDLQHLKKLDLSNNNLKDLSGLVFADLINLQELDLTGNPIRSISEDFFASLPNGLALSFDEHSLDFKSQRLVDQWAL